MVSTEETSFSHWSACLTGIRKSMIGGRAAAILIRLAKNWAKDRVKNNNAISLTIHGTNGMVARMVKGEEVTGVNNAFHLVRNNNTASK
jgi:hypothetical protein